MADATELFPDRGYVRLLSCVHEEYLHADEDGFGVSLTHSRASLNTVWQVHRVQRSGVDYVLLHGAAYGRYLALSPDLAPSGHRGRRAVQREFDQPDQLDVTWRAVEAEDGSDHVLLRHAFNRNLRVNGRYRIWNTGVSVDDNYGRPSTMMHWTVEDVGLTLLPPSLPPPTTEQGGRRTLFRWLTTRLVGERWRTIRYVRADDQGRFDQHGWTAFHFDGRSVLNLRNEVMIHEGEHNYQCLRLCAKAGFYGRLTPLLVDLPRCEEPMDIVVLTTGSPACGMLRYPDVDDRS